MSTNLAERPVTLESHKGPLHIASVTLTVRDADRVASFYQNVIGLSVIAESGNRIDLGNDGVGLVTLLADPRAEVAPPGAPDLFHTAFVLPTREDLGRWLATAMANQWEIEGASDHLVSEAVYLSDPEGNGIEIYRDRPRAEWPGPDGKLRMANARLDGQGLLDLAKDGPGRTYAMPRGARVGHVHLCVSALDQASVAMEGTVGLVAMYRYPGAIFFGSEGYHHHIATNVWRNQGQSSRVPGQLGLAGVTLSVAGPSQDAMRARWNGASGLTMLDGLTFAMA